MQVALFDLDGVIIDTEPLYSEFWKGIGEIYFPNDKDFALKLKGQTLTDIYEHFFKENIVAQSEIRHRLSVFESTMPFPYIEGAIDYVKFLKQQGVPTAIVTSSDKYKMERLYSAHPDFHQLFNIILTAEDSFRSKPAPDCYINAAKCLGVTPKACVVFEDSLNGLKAARDSGAYVVGVATSLCREEIASLCDMSICNFSSDERQKSCIDRLFSN